MNTENKNPVCEPYVVNYTEKGMGWAFLLGISPILGIVMTAACFIAVSPVAGFIVLAVSVAVVVLAARMTFRPKKDVDLTPILTIDENKISHTPLIGECRAFFWDDVLSYRAEGPSPRDGSYVILTLYRPNSDKTREVSLPIPATNQQELLDNLDKFCRIHRWKAAGADPKYNPLTWPQ